MEEGTPAGRLSARLYWSRTCLVIVVAATAGAAAASSVTAPPSKQQQQQPHLLFALADDLGGVAAQPAGTLRTRSRTPRCLLICD